MAKIEVDDLEWDESEPCPKCACRVLKIMYATKYNERKMVSSSILIIQCPSCDYEKEVEQ